MNAQRPPQHPQSRACDYCQLPVLGATADEAAAVYCCLGCQLAAAITSDQAAADGGLGRTAIQLGLAIFFTMNVMVFTMALWSWDAYAIAASPHATLLKDLLRLACLLFATPVVLILGRPLLVSVVQQWSAGRTTTDLLLAVGVATAYTYSVVSVLSGQPHVYFEVACTILVAVTLGRWLEAAGKQRAMKSLGSLQSLLPRKARVVGPHGQPQHTALADVHVGDTIRVLPGERIPLDGVVCRGQSYVDQQLVTGESQAVCRTAGDRVFGGTLNLDGCVDVRVSAAASSGVIQRLVAMVHAAAHQTSRPERLADRLARIFVPLVFVLAIAVFVVHWQLNGWHAALMASLAVTLIACPCALAIATPLAVWAGLSCAAKQGVIFRTSDDLIRLAGVDIVCFDKTGTLTTDQPQLAKTWFEDAEEAEQVLDVAQQLSAQTLHPLGKALGTCLGDRVAPQPLRVGPATSVAGRGVTAELTCAEDEPQSNTLALMGSLQLFRERDGTISAAAQSSWEAAVRQGRPAVCVGWGGRIRGIFAFDETLREAAGITVQRLQNQGLRTLLLTGDQVERARRIGKTTSMEIAADLLPGDKLQMVAQLQADRHSVAMLGDGLNDAPALGAADVGIALGCGADVARDAADVCLLSPVLQLVPWAIELARDTQRTIRRNLFWAVGYNSVGITLAAAGKLNPILAAVAMVFSSGFVIVESLRLAARPGPLPAVSAPPASVDHRATTALTTSPAPAVRMEPAG